MADGDDSAPQQLHPSKQNSFEATCKRSHPGAALHGSQHSANPSENADGFPQLVLPNTDDAPTLLAERAGYKTVAVLVAGEFLHPESAVVGRHVGVLRATVPETAIDKHSNALTAKGEVRPADKGGVTTPAGDAFGAEQPGTRVRCEQRTLPACRSGGRRATAGLFLRPRR